MYYLWILNPLTQSCSSPFLEEITAMSGQSAPGEGRLDQGTRNVYSPKRCLGVLVWGFGQSFSATDHPSPLESQSKYLADALGAHCITEAACSLRSPEWHFVCAALVLYLLYLSHRNMRWGGKEGSGGILEAGREWKLFLKAAVLCAELWSTRRKEEHRVFTKDLSGSPILQFIWEWLQGNSGVTLM